MMKKIYAAYLLLMLMVSAHWVGFRPIPAMEGTEGLNQVKEQFYAGLEEWEQTAVRLQQTAEGMSREGGDLENLRQAHFQARLAFKAVEFLVEYIDPASVKEFINGPPLPRVDTKSPGIHILEPRGMQVLDELLFEEAPLAELEEIRLHCADLSASVQQVKNYQRSVKLTHRHVFEAGRQEMIRIFTLGVTGFDTPGSGHALPEAQVAMKAVAKAISAYYPLLEREAPKLRRELEKTFQEAVKFLDKTPDFDRFDRMAFLRNYINPLYSLLYQAQRALGIETKDEVDPLPAAVNYHAQNLFSPELLDPFYFADLSRQELTPQRVELGRILFFDPILSSTNERSCASCHHPERAFTDGQDRSTALHREGKIQRNAMTVINSIFSERFFADMREEKLDRQIKHVVVDQHEFGTDFPEIVEKLQKSSEYKALFAEAYKDYPQYQVSRWSISHALACYLSTLHSFNSPFDRYVRGESQKLDAAAIRGFNLFMGKANCGICHFAPVFNGTVPPLYQETESEVLGVPFSTDTLNPRMDPDLGRYASSRPHDGAPFYYHSFKTTTVRNVALTAPYMHNGIYQTLEEVMNFYNRGGGKGLGFDLPNQTLPPDPLHLNRREVQDLIAFMHSLTDTTGLTLAPTRLPRFEQQPEWDRRNIGGEY